MSDATVYTWKGRPIGTLTREELIEALGRAIRDLRSERESHRENLSMEQLFATARQTLARRT